MKMKKKLYYQNSKVNILKNFKIFYQYKETNEEEIIFISKNSYIQLLNELKESSEEILILQKKINEITKKLQI